MISEVTLLSLIPNSHIIDRKRIFEFSTKLTMACGHEADQIDPLNLWVTLGFSVRSSGHII